MSFLNKLASLASGGMQGGARPPRMRAQQPGMGMGARQMMAMPAPEMPGEQMMPPAQMMAPAPPAAAPMRPPMMARGEEGLGFTNPPDRWKMMGGGRPRLG